MGDIFFLNLFGLTILIDSIFYLVITLYLFLFIKDKSKATWHIAFSFLFSFFLAVPYVPAYTLYMPMGAYHRWMTVPAALLIFPHYAQVFYYFPETRYRRVARIALAIQYTAAFLMTVFFIKTTLSRELVYNFSGHFWDFDADDVSKMVGILMLANVAFMVFSGIFHLITRKTDRLPIFGILGGMMLAVIVPVITNVLSRDGLLARDIHQMCLVLFSITGLFTVMVVYLNNTVEKTTFMVKIIGVSLVTYMLLMVFISFFSLQDQDDAYTTIHAEQTSRLTIDNKYPVSDLKYLMSYDLVRRQDQFITMNEISEDLNPQSFRNELINTALYERIKALRGETWRKQLPIVLHDAPASFQGYKNYLISMSANAANPDELLSMAEKKAQRLTYHSIKVHDIPEAVFREKLKDYVKKFSPDLWAFAQALDDFQKSHPDYDNARLKKETALFFSAFRPEGTRHFRSDRKGTHYASFMKYDQERNLVFEAGYSYTVYRNFTHRVGLKLAVMFLLVVFVIVFGYRIFFLGTLVRPLESLLSGVRKVNSGDLQVELPVRIPDEIGFITDSFNGMVSSIRSARQKLENYAEELEDRVKERTAALSETLKTVQGLKSQQDGDYFLTSLLIKPLTRNLAKSKTVNVEFFIEQKKKFSFRKWDEEIGGDFCSAHGIKLAEKDYTIFVNADAMGKSVQGAGGALVLGAVFESILDRTRNIPSFKDQSPERWLKNAFLELQKVFESFDGSMLVSMVMGLVDDDTGLMYYLNVEHPWSVLYRDKKAAFIESGNAFRKLGISGLEGQLKILTMHLQPDDVLIVGSDGRDDLELSVSEEGDRVINEDENLFLRMVEAGEGRLSSIYSNITEMGSITDDLSMIRISYRPSKTPISTDNQNLIEDLRKEAAVFLEEKKYLEAETVINQALKIDPRNIELIRLQVRTFMEKKDFANAFNSLEDYIYLRPMDTEMLYLASYLCKELKKPQEAIDYGERVRLRAPEFVANLINLSDVYSSIGNRDRAVKMADEALLVDPTNEKANRRRADLA